MTVEQGSTWGESHVVLLPRRCLLPLVEAAHNLSTGRLTKVGKAPAFRGHSESLTFGM